MSARDEFLVEAAAFNDLFEFARFRRVEICAETVDRDRQWRNTVGAEAAGAKESILDFDEEGSGAFKFGGRLRSGLGTPDRDRSFGRHVLGIPEEAEWGRAVPKQRRNMILFPKGKAEPASNVAIGVDQLPPESAQLDSFEGAHRLASERVFERGFRELLSEHFVGVADLWRHDIAVDI